MLSVILPVRCGPGNAYLLERLAANLTLFGAHPEVECVVVDSASASPYAEQIRKLCERERCRLVIDPAPQQPFAPGLTRNAGAVVARGDVLLFYDVDLCAGPGLVDQIFAALGPAPAWNDFLVIPSLFLTEEGSRAIKFTGDPVDLRPALASLFAGENHTVANLAATHLVVPRRTFLRLGGNNPAYRGHGCEDFDILHRLASYRPLGRRSPDYYLDHRTRFVGDYRGFRAYLVRYALPHLFGGLITAHLWHPRPLRRSYFRQRGRNEALLQRFMKRHDGGERLSPLRSQGLPTPDTTFEITLPVPWVDEGPALLPIADFIRELMARHGYGDDSPGLFSWKPGVTVPTRSSNRLRKLLLRPREFFADSRVLRRLFSR